MKGVVKKAFNTCGFEVARRQSGTNRHEISYPPTTWLSKFNVRTVLDIGANEGDFARAIGGRLPAARIYSFEPLAGAYAKLCEKTNGFAQYKAYNFALGDVSGQLEIHRNAYSPSSSILPMSALHRTSFPIASHDAGVEKIEIRRLDDIAEDMGFLDDVFVKIDVQGFEANVIRGGQQALKRAKVVIVETSFDLLYENQPLFDQIYGMMKELGFLYSGNWDQLIDPASGRILQADAIFISRSLS